MVDESLGEGAAKPPPLTSAQASPRVYKSTVTMSAFIAGGVAGVANAGLFNWWDKGLYESVRTGRPFLRASNFVRPWQGFQAAIFGRMLSYGMFFPVQESFESLYGRHPWLEGHPELLRLVASQSTGALLTLPLAPVSAIKYRMWGAPCGSSAGYASTAKTMFLGAGYSLRPFFHGIGPTLWRDCLWAATFNGLRHRGLAWARGSFEGGAREVAEFAAVTLAGALATTLSSPFNYARNMVYATRQPASPPKTWASIRALFRNARDFDCSANLLNEASRSSAGSGKLRGPRQRLVGQLLFLQRNLAVGWGTARVAVGMAVGSRLYEGAKASLDSQEAKQEAEQEARR